MKLDWKKLDGFIESNLRHKPDYLEVSNEEWRAGLLSAREGIPEGFVGTETADEAWMLIYFCAIYFCKGIEHTRTAHL